MTGQFEIAAGSIIGRNHFRMGKNNQDAYSSLSSEQATIAVVCDGCSGAPHSEVGAKLGAQLTVNAIAQTLTAQADPGSGDFWQDVQQNLLAHLQTIAQMLGNPIERRVNDFLLFTIVGLVITPQTVTTFSVGDGVILLNGEALDPGEFPGNAPPYLAYHLIPQEIGEMPQEWLQFQVHGSMPTESVASVLIGTDGVKDLMAVALNPVPGQSDPVGAISQFWQEDRYFRNPDCLRRRLAILNRDVTRTNWQDQRVSQEAGLLPDDTTMVVIRPRSH